MSKLNSLKTKNPFHYVKRILAVGVAGFEPATSCSQSRRDDRATLHPGLSVIKRISGFTIILAERQGLEPWRHLRVDRLAICSITTLAPLLFFLLNVAYFAVANVTFSFYLMKLFLIFLIGVFYSDMKNIGEFFLQYFFNCFYISECYICIYKLSIRRLCIDNGFNKIVDRI